jgi:hypothetical protein
MQAIPVDVRRFQSGSDLQSDLERARQLAQLMDAQFSIAGVRFGFDSLIGLIPGVGDAVTLAMGLYPLLVARRHKLGKLVEWRMMMNLGIDFAGGLLPIAGDVFDLFYKANLKNLALLERAAAKKQGT